MRCTAPLTAVVLAELAAGSGCRGPSLDAEAEGPSEAETAETSTETGDDSDPLACEPWLEPPTGRALGMGSTLLPSFVDATDEFGLVDTSYYGDLWPPGCDPEGEGWVGTPCKMLLQGGGAAVADYDADGWPDIYLTRLVGADLLLRNQRGEGVEGFAEVGAEVGLGDAFGGNGAAWVDVDGDRDLDLYVTTFELDGRFWFYRNELAQTGVASFVEEAGARGLALDDGLPRFGFSIGVGDYDRDSWLDLYTTEWWPGSTPGPDTNHARLLRNLGPGAPGVFEDRTLEAGASMLMINPAGMHAFSPTFVDLDEDGWQDLAVVSDNGTTRLFWNRIGAGGDGFVDGTPRAGVSLERNGMGSSFGDVDGDGHLDWYVTAIFSPDDEDVECGNSVCGNGGNRLYLSEQRRCFVDVAVDHDVAAGGWGWGASFWDPDNDGDLDIVETNGFQVPHGPPGTFFAGDPMRFWHNRSEALGGLGFVERATEVGLVDQGQGRGLVTFDYDRDGDLDLLVVDNAGRFGTRTKLWRNETGDQNAWLDVELDGRGGNRFGVGARVEVQREVDGPWQVQVVGLGGHFLGHGEYRAHFGLGPSDAPVAQLRVLWPGGQQTLRSDVDVRRVVTIEEP